jgi:hypothetical protein
MRGGSLVSYSAGVLDGVSAWQGFTSSERYEWHEQPFPTIILVMHFLSSFGPLPLHLRVVVSVILSTLPY